MGRRSPNARWCVGELKFVVIQVKQGSLEKGSSRGFRWQHHALATLLNRCTSDTEQESNIYDYT